MSARILAVGRVLVLGSVLGALACGRAPAPAERAPEPAPPAAVFARGPMIAALIARVDDDGDGLVSPAEHARWAAGKTPFGELDLDASGLLDAAEVEEAIGFILPKYHPVPAAGSSGPPAGP